VPVDDRTEAIRMFRVVLEDYRQLCRRRKQLESEIVERLTPILTRWPSRRLDDG
jgi:hypothetical protein